MPGGSAIYTWRGCPGAANSTGGRRSTIPRSCARCSKSATRAMWDWSSSRRAIRPRGWRRRWHCATCSGHWRRGRLKPWSDQTQRVPRLQRRRPCRRSSKNAGTNTGRAAWKASLPAHHQNAPGLLAHLHLLEHGARGHVDDGHVARGAVGGEQQLLIRRKRDAPGAVAHFEGPRDVAGGRFQHHHFLAAPGGDVELPSVARHGHAHGLQPGAHGNGLHHFELRGVDHAYRGVVLIGDVGARSIRQENDAARTASHGDRLDGLPRGGVHHGNGALVLSLIHISEPTRRTPLSYAVFCLKKKKTT